MRIIARHALHDFAAKYPDAKGHLDTWWKVAKKANWPTPQAVKETFPKASIVANNRVVFNIKGGSYRLVVQFQYKYGRGFIRFIGTHRDYDQIDVTEI